MSLYSVRRAVRGALARQKTNHRGTENTEGRNTEKKEAKEEEEL
jgi:hypothetical protein